MGTKGTPTFALALLILVAGCTGESSSDAAPNDTIRTTTVPTSAPASTETTISAEEENLLAIAEAESDITELVETWYTFPVDTAKGEAGLPLELLTGDLLARWQTFDDDPATIQRSRGNSRIEIRDIRVDLGTGLADIDVCTQGDDELVSAATGEVIAADDGTAWEGQVQADLVEGQWKLSEFYTEAIDGGAQCVIVE